MENMIYISETEYKRLLDIEVAYKASIKNNKAAYEQDLAHLQQEMALNQCIVNQQISARSLQTNSTL